MHFLALVSLSTVAALVAAECCGSGANCNGVGRCNMWCCNCDARYRFDISRHVCSVFACFNENTGSLCDPSPKLARSEHTTDLAAADLEMLKAATGGKEEMTLDAFVEYSKTLGQTDYSILVARFNE
ncbi:hypothetical protein EK21DRAFT_85312 [Setomelanomma holmii]|uniref:Secreted protein n=1 Tax=Setomelanomma holmii TaxID=210430 RepID=A0A9P4HGU6_9PLEO|nr:hypothetical protein EK21DRAFT_85312 [Setomelanomma holmii]